ncbi:MAG: hypothetical protein JXA21_12530 [Anaerolineae bacterium]|nr:hypothetical protein [Anaerolineae bacterium]
MLTWQDNRNPRLESAAAIQCQDILYQYKRKWEYCKSVQQIKSLGNGEINAPVDSAGINRLSFSTLFQAYYQSNCRSWNKSVLSSQRTDYLVTNELAQDNVAVVQDVDGFRWNIAQFHRETKQLTEIEGCQCRKVRIVRNHIGCAILVWVRLKQVAYETQRTIYQVKHGLLDDYLRQQPKSPTIQMRLA